MRWQSAAPPRGGASDLLVGTTTIRVRINVMPWLKRTARIYLVAARAAARADRRLLDHAGTAPLRDSSSRATACSCMRAHHQRLHRGHAEVSVQRERGAHRPPVPRQLSLRNGRVTMRHAGPLTLASALPFARRPRARVQGFAALVSPPRFELSREAGEDSAQRHRDQQSLDRARASMSCTPPTGTSRRISA